MSSLASSLWKMGMLSVEDIWVHCREVSSFVFVHRQGIVRVPHPRTQRSDTKRDCMIVAEIAVVEIASSPLHMPPGQKVRNASLTK